MVTERLHISSAMYYIPAKRRHKLLTSMLRQLLSWVAGQLQQSISQRWIEPVAAATAAAWTARSIQH